MENTMCINKNESLLPFYNAIKIKLSYDYSSGLITWAYSHGQFKKGTVAGTVDNKGYQQLTIRLNGDRKTLSAHRVAWFMFYGTLPNMIDHINGDKTDNCIRNLRDCNNSQNQANSGIQKNNTTGYKGVYLNKPKGNWFARINHNNKMIHLGMFSTPEEASKIYKKKAKDLFGEFYKQKGNK